MDKAKVLIVENEVIVAMDLKSILTKLEFIVTDTVSNGNNVLSSIEKNEPDIILMDIKLGQDKDGIDIVNDIYTIKYIPVIYLTGIYDDDEILNRAIETNPVGYLIKPYNKEELKANILLGIYKNSNTLNDISDKDYKYLGFNYYYDTMNKNLYYQNHIIKLGKKETILLDLLVQANGETVLFETIENEIWGNSGMTSNAMRKVIYRLRNKIDYKFIQSVPYFGFKL